MDFEPTYRVFPGREINDSGMISIYLENLKTNTTSEIKRITPELLSEILFEGLESVDIERVREFCSDFNVKFQIW